MNESSAEGKFPLLCWAIFASLFFLISFLAMLAASFIKVAETRSLLEVYAAESRHYYEVYGEWPRTIGDFQQNPRGITFINSKALLSSDSWGHPWIYEQFDASRGYGRTRSLGRDGKPGGTGLDRDIELIFAPNSSAK